jgi:hypothetical protein
MLQQPDVMECLYPGLRRRAAGEFNKHDWMCERLVAGDQLNKSRISATEMINPYRCIDEDAH